MYVLGYFWIKVYVLLNEDEYYLVKLGIVIDYFLVCGSFYLGCVDLKDLISCYYSNLVSEVLVKK